MFSPRYTERDKAHGRIEERTIQLSPQVGGLRFPHAAQGFRCERTAHLRNGKVRHEVVYGVSSLATDHADEKRMLRLLRGHWTIEALHHIRDVSFAEDCCRIRSGTGPQAMAALRNLAIGVIKTVMTGSVAGAHRRLMMNPELLLQVVGA